MQVTYIAPEGDAKVVLMGGFSFEDGVAVDVPADHRIAPKLRTNQHFIVDEGDEQPEADGEDAPRRRGRPRKADLAND